MLPGVADEIAWNMWGRAHKWRRARSAAVAWGWAGNLRTCTVRQDGGGHGHCHGWGGVSDGESGIPTGISDDIFRLS